MLRRFHLFILFQRVVVQLFCCPFIGLFNIPIIPGNLAFTTLQKFYQFRLVPTVSLNHRKQTPRKSRNLLVSFHSTLLFKFLVILLTHFSERSRFQNCLNVRRIERLLASNESRFCLFVWMIKINYRYFECFN